MALAPSSACCGIPQTVAVALKLDQISNVHWHFFDLCIVELLNVTEVSYIAFCQEVDSYSLTSETSGTSNTMNVVFTVCG